jgi:aminopeptidase N
MRRITSFLVASGLVVSSSTLPADTYPRQLAVDAVHYRFAVTLAESSARIEGETHATLRIVAPVRAIELDLMSASGEKGMTVSGVTSGGRVLQFSHDANRLRLPVPEDAKPGHDVTYVIRYAGIPIDGLQVFTNMHGERVVFSEGWPNRARHWLPTIDHPYDKATGEMIVIAPAQYQAVSNGVLVEEVDLGSGQRRTHWRQSVPIASWLFALGLARFDAHHAGTVQGVPLQTWVFPQNRDAGRELFEQTSRRAMDFFSERIGPYPYERLANVQAAGFAGGMENATVIFYGEKGVASGRGPVAHEIAHQWFGNSVTERDWDDVWLSEGFATYFALLYVEQFQGRDAFVQGLMRSRTTILQLEQKRPDTPVIHRNLSDMERLLNQFVYQKGGWILHMLRRELGDEAFWRGIREYYRRYRDRNASTDELRQVMEGTSGKDLGWFFAQWLTRSGVPRIEGSWTYDAAQKRVVIMLAQVQAGAPFRVRVGVGLADTPGAPPRVEPLELDEAKETFFISSATMPSTVTLDPDTWVLADMAPLTQR